MLLYRFLPRYSYGCLPHRESLHSPEHLMILLSPSQTESRWDPLSRAADLGFSGVYSRPLHSPCGGAVARDAL